MPKKKLDVRNNYVPSDYDDLYRYYIQGNGSLCMQIIRHMMPHATPDELETLPQDVFTRLQEKDQINIFDPDKANFGGVIFYVTRTIVCNHLDRKGRNPITGLHGGTLATNEPEDGEFEPGCYSLSRLFGAPAPNYEAQFDARAIIFELMDWARSLYEHPRHKRDASLFPLLQLMADEADAADAAEKLEVTTSTISNWVGVIREKAFEIRTRLESQTALAA
jgi:hypothetical protein